MKSHSRGHSKAEVKCRFTIRKSEIGTIDCTDICQFKTSEVQDHGSLLFLEAHLCGADEGGAVRRKTD